MTVQAMSTETRASSSHQLGKYQLVATLGQGGMGTVYLALASGFGEFRKLLVLKELRQDLTRQEGFVSMFMDEAKLAARLSHPNVVQTFEAGESDNRYFLAMEYLDGQSLSTVLERTAKPGSAKLSRAMHIQILCEALEGLHYAHELLDYDGSSLNVVHRDVSPQNVFVTYHGQVKVVDFGVAKVANASVKTAPGMFVGKFSYAAPEQVLGGPVDARTDVFAMGVMLWQAIAGRPFSQLVPTIAACRARRHGLEPRIGDMVPNVDPVLARICDRALAVDPDERFASAKEFRCQLQDYVQQAGVRVEASEIGQLMHGVFDAERRSMHASIEQAMRHTGGTQSSVENLGVPLAGQSDLLDKATTTVADLSSLIEVSIEHDDHKIQEGYAHSKVTLVRPRGEQKRGIDMRTFIGTPWHRLLGFSAVGLAMGIGLIWAVFRDPGPEGVAIPLPPAAIASSPVVPAIAATPEVIPPQELGDVFETQVSAATDPPATVPDAVTTVRASRKNQANASQPSAGWSRSRFRPSTTRPDLNLETADHSAAPVSAAETSARKRRIEEGSNLTFNRRPPVRIDSESPYQ